MKIVSYNLHQLIAPARRSILAEVAAALVELRPDLVACQEILECDGRGVRQVERLEELLGMRAFFAANARTRRGLLGNATFCRGTAELVDNVDLSVPGYERRGALRVRLPDGVTVWNLHLGLTRRQRRHQWSRIAAEMTDPGHHVLCGDFNDWSGALEHIVRREGLSDVLHGHGRAARRTFPARWPLFGLDRIYHTGFAVAEARVLTGAPWVRLSDHLPILTTLQ